MASFAWSLPCLISNRQSTSKQRSRITRATARQIVDGLTGTATTKTETASSRQQSHLVQPSFKAHRLSSRKRKTEVSVELQDLSDHNTIPLARKRRKRTTKLARSAPEHVSSHAASIPIQENLLAASMSSRYINLMSTQSCFLLSES